ncbi:TonB-dependent receptor [Novosphingobium flavum]|uniref:TonB-dependent receptor n=1 Tax=Novosphingobium flavum TaxID=1778672 RepID=A0A7X1KLA0_9SPHN|nr:TonB-dependent receptor [Novosphingobium flavum]
MAVSSGAHAQEVRQYNISPGNLKASLQQFARQSDREILFDARLVANKRTKGFAGRADAEKVLADLLEGSHLTFTKNGAGTLLVTAQAAQPAAARPQARPRRPQPAAVQPVADSEPEAAAPLEPEADIVVTGSRLTNGNNSPTPVTIVSVDQLKAAKPATVFEALLDVPAFAGSRGGTSSNPTGNGANSGQISALNLRGLGPVRTLILYDGHRVPPTQQDGLVDANTVPELLLSRVDVVTGGASAVYGSDAIGGVVNFITDRKFTGLKLDLQGGLSQRSDAGTYQIGGAAGANLFGGRGHIEASVQNLHDNGILDRNARAQFLGRWTVQGNGCPNGVGSANCVPFYLVSGANATAWTYGGKIVGPSNTAQRTNPLLNYTFDGVGSPLRPFVNGATVPGSSAIQIGGDGIYDTGTTLKPEQDILQAFGRFDYDVADNVHFYTSLAYTRDHTFNLYGDVNSNSIVFSVNNAYFARDYADARQQFLNAGITTFNFSKKYGPGDHMPKSNIDNTTKTIYWSAGLEGSFGDGYKWELGYTKSDVELTTYSNFTLANGRFFAATDAVVNPVNGQIVCNVTLTNPGLYPGCVPINVFGTGSESQEAIDYVRRQGMFVTKLPMDDISGSMTGKPFDLWAGPVALAFSGEWRRQGLETESTNQTVDYAPLDCTGLRYNCTPVAATNVGTPQYNGGVAPRPPVHIDVAEAALEADVPLLKDAFLAQSLSLNLAGRYAKYWATGNPDLTKPALHNEFEARTWKVGIDWEINDSVRLRATRSRDIRAPNLFELYRSNGTTFSNAFTDFLTGRQLTGTNTQPALVNGGNPNLKPEKADTLTLGIVIKPWSQFSFSVDYYNIKVRDFITTLSGVDQVTQQTCYDGNALYCTLQERPGPLTDTSATNAITRYFALPANIAELSTKGIDFETNFSTRIAGRPFTFRGLVSYQPHLVLKQPATKTQDFAGALGAPAGSQASAKLRMTAAIHFEPTDHLALDWQTRFRGKMHQSPDPTLLEEANAGAPAVTFSDVTVSYKVPAVLNGRATLYLNVANVFDQMAPIAASYPLANAPGLNGGGFVLGDNPIGRYFRLGLRARW